MLSLQLQASKKIAAIILKPKSISGSIAQNACGRCFARHPSACSKIVIARIDGCTTGNQGRGDYDNSHCTDSNQLAARKPGNSKL